MNPKPQELFLGVTDLFVILLPGAVLLYVMLFALYGYPLERLPALHWSDTEAGAFALVASYILGHFVSLVASAVEDGFFRQRDFRKESSTLRVRVEAELAKYGFDVKQAPEKVRRRAEKMVTYSTSPAAIRLERRAADRRFQRNMVLVAFLSLLLLGFTGRTIEGVVAAFLFVGFLLRYWDQNRKFTEEVFEAFIGMKENVKAAAARKLSAGERVKSIRAAD